MSYPVCGDLSGLSYLATLLLGVACGLLISVVLVGFAVAHWYIIEKKELVGE